MANYKSELQDIYFNLFDVLNIQDSGHGLDQEDIKGIIIEFDKFVENEIFPTREESDAVGVTLKDGEVTCPAVLQKCHQNYHANGWFALGFPEEIEGTPVPEALAAICISLSTAANAAWMMYPGLSRGALNVIRLKASEELKKAYIPKLITGEWGGTMCLTEAGAGSDVGALRTTAKDNGDGSYQVSGVKIFISAGDNDLYKNNVHLVLARTPGAPEGTKGISLFAVPKFIPNEDSSLGERNDVWCTKIEHKMGIHASATCELTFGQNGSCKGWLVGNEFEGMANMFIMMNEARMYCGVQGESQGVMSYLMAKDYVKERVQFGKEISKHPDIKRMILKMRAQARGMRALILYTANLFDKHGDAESEGLIGLLTPICKAYCTDTGYEVATEAVQAHGGYGYCTEYGVEQFIRDTKITKIYEGTNGIQAIDFVMRKILKDGGKTLRNLSGKMLIFANDLDDELWGKQKGLMMKVLGHAAPIVESFASRAKAGKFELILQHCTDFLKFSSQLVVAWRLGEAAVIAHEKLANAEGEEEIFLKSKVLDFRIYCQQVLVHNIAIAKSINDFEIDLTTIEI
jgi:alkylation response protein AidB-like acyl-CoA dehydrogenase